MKFECDLSDFHGKLNKITSLSQESGITSKRVGLRTWDGRVELYARSHYAQIRSFVTAQIIHEGHVGLDVTSFIDVMNGIDVWGTLELVGNRLVCQSLDLKVDIPLTSAEFDDYYFSLPQPLSEWIPDANVLSSVAYVIDPRTLGSIFIGNNVVMAIDDGGFRYSAIKLDSPTGVEVPAKSDPRVAKVLSLGNAKFALSETKLLLMGDDYEAAVPLRDPSKGLDNAKLDDSASPDFSDLTCFRISRDMLITRLTPLMKLSKTDIAMATGTIKIETGEDNGRVKFLTPATESGEGEWTYQTIVDGDEVAVRYLAPDWMIQAASQFKTATPLKIYLASNRTYVCSDDHRFVHCISNRGEESFRVVAEALEEKHAKAKTKQATS